MICVHDVYIYILSGTHTCRYIYLEYIHDEYIYIYIICIQQKNESIDIYILYIIYIYYIYI
jgi:hypothetical protein